MAAVIPPQVSTSAPSPRSGTGSRRRRPVQAQRLDPGKRDRPTLTPVEALPRRQRPLWLRCLVWGQVASVLATTGLVGGVFVLYGFTVQTNRQLNSATQHLQTLQTRAQQLVTGKAILRHHLAQQAALGSLQNPHQGVIFLEPAAAPEVKVPPIAPPATLSRPLSRPLGY